MKRIAGLDAQPPSLTLFHNDPGIENTWDALRNHTAYMDLKTALVVQQHGLCAYCEIDLVPDDTSIEHVVPRSDRAQGAALSCDADNMLAICRGGGNVAVYGPMVRQPDLSRVLPPVERNLSCGQSKRNRPASDFLDPRRVPGDPSLMNIEESGRIGSEQKACESHAIDPAVVDNHIVGLGLNVERLRIRREAIWLELAASFSIFADLPEEDRADHLTMLAESQLLPNRDGRLAPFFTTARSFFGPLAEAILAAPPQSWI